MLKVHLKMRRKLLLGLISSGLCINAPRSIASTNSLLPTGKLRVGWAPWYPYGFKDPKHNNQMSGITVDLMEALARYMKTETVYVEDSWATIIAGLQAGKFDVLMPMAITPPRAQAADFSKEFLKVDMGLMIRKSDAGTLQSWKDLDKDGYSISVAMGSNTALYANQVFKKARVVEMKGEPEAVTSLITGRVNAWASVYSAFSGSAPGRSQLVVVPGEPFAYNPVAVVVQKNNQGLLVVVNDFLSEYRSSPEFLAAIDHYGLRRDAITTL